MATTAATLVARTRRFVRDYPEMDTLAASLTSSATTVTTTQNPANALYGVRRLIQVDQEALRVKTASSSAGSITVLRAANGTTAATHASSAKVLVDPHFLDIEILDALNAGLSAAFPIIYRPVVDQTLTTSASTYEYSIPDMPGITSYKIPYISEVWMKDSGETDYQQTRAFTILRGATPKLQFYREQPASSTIRLKGYGPFAALAIGDSLNALFPPNAEDVLTWFAGNYLLASGEAGRVRADTGASDNREQANRVGSSMVAANSLFQRFQLRLQDAGMGPMPRHVLPTFR